MATANSIREAALQSLKEDLELEYNLGESLELLLQEVGVRQTDAISRSSSPVKVHN